MSYVSLSGLSSAQLDLNTTSNNIANANTYGFKESRAEFSDVYSNSLFTNAKPLRVAVHKRTKWRNSSTKVQAFTPTTQWICVYRVRVSSR